MSREPDAPAREKTVFPRWRVGLTALTSMPFLEYELPPELIAQELQRERQLLSDRDLLKPSDA